MKKFIAHVKTGKYLNKTVPGPAVDASQANCDIKLLGGKQIRRGDVIVRRPGDDIQNALVMTVDDFMRQYVEVAPIPQCVAEPGRWDASKGEAVTVSTTLVLGSYDRSDTRSIEKAWLEVEAATGLLVKRSLQLQTLNGASRESAQASLRLREAAFWLSQRKQIVPTTVAEIKAAVA